MNQSPQAILRAIVATLSPTISGLKGVIEFAKDPLDLIRLLTVSPTTFRIVLMWPGYAANPEAALGVSTDRLEAVIQVATGLHISNAQTFLIERPAATPNILSLIETTRELICALRFPTDAGIDPHGYTLANSDWLIIEGIDTTQHQLSFTLDRALTYHATTIPVTL
jgi:hypothetical protein